MMNLAKIKTIAYWLTTGILGLDFLAGGVANLVRPPQLLSTMMHLGYPTYFLSILGVWKLLGGLALLAPGMPWLKEWAYAGVFFDLTSAALSHAASGDSAAKVVAPLVVGVFAAASYLFRPESRALSVVEEPERIEAAGRDLAA
jgi:hypothetical protein